MKIQDIFKLPNNKGKAKLFQRIMNRYGIPKEDSKELKKKIRRRCFIRTCRFYQTIWCTSASSCKKKKRLL